MPGFLKRVDQKLLLNKPGIWSTRIHLVVYYGILFLLVLGVICFLEPNDPRANSTTEPWVGFVSLIAGIGFIVWMIYLLRFNVFKKYGIIHPLHALVTFFLYFISTGIIVSFGYVHPIVETAKANMAYSTKEIVDDVNNINIKIYQLEYNQFQGKWDYDTVELVKKDTAVAAPVYDDAQTFVDTIAAPVEAVSRNEYDHYQYDSTGFSNKINAADSLIKLKDSLYLVYQTPQLQFLDPYLYNVGIKEHLLSDFELFRKVHGHRSTLAQQDTIYKELSLLLKKYEYPVYASYPTVEVGTSDSRWEIIQKKYRLPGIESSISHVLKKKYRWNGNDLQVYIRIFYYLTLGFTLLIFIFRHTTVRTFFLSILAGVLITIFTVLILSFARAEAIQVLVCLSAYVVLFLFLASTVFWAKKRSAISGIALNIFTLIVAAVPISLLALYYEYRHRQLRLNNIYDVEPFDLEKYAIYAEVGGSVLLLVLISTYLSKAYRRWYALPEN
ncbi:hypothetical protein [Niastella sp. OAS944]|uniref:hypothetical protein n=1 Tax=Niastella sp. OAS944 TaxID=2664089 RepID=UPI0035C7D805|nr:hypothetical protein [Chitinophagaceae bacterium OAS944]